MTQGRGSGRGSSALPQAWLEVGASTAPSWLPMLAAPLSSTVAPVALTQHARGWNQALSLYSGDAGQRLVHAHVLPSDFFLTLGSVGEMCAGTGKSQRRITQQAVQSGFEHFSQDILHDTTESISMKGEQRQRQAGV